MNKADPKRFCMLSYSAYELDNRVRRYAEALSEQGHRVHAICLNRTLDQPCDITINGVHVHRLQARLGKNEKGKVAFLLPIIKFWCRSFGWLTREHFRHRFSMIHVHNIPDFLVFAAIIPRIFGAKIIHDIHDLVPEFFASKFQSASSSWLVRTLRVIERLSASFAHHVIISNDLWRRTIVNRSVRQEKCSVFINYVDPNVFYPRQREKQRGERKLILYPGGLQRHQGVDIAIRAFARVSPNFPEAEFHIYGEGDQKSSLIALVDELKITDRIQFFEPLPVLEISERMGQADLALVPKRAESFGGTAFSTKILEFMALGIPLIISRTPIDEFYFNDQVVRFFESGNDEELAFIIRDMLTNKSHRTKLAENALEFARSRSWAIRSHDYLRIVDELLALGEAKSFCGDDQTCCQESVTVKSDQRPSRNLSCPGS